MTNRKTNCQVCGRTEGDQLETPNREIKLEKHQGIQKCKRCIREYRTGNNTDTEKQQPENNQNQTEDLDVDPGTNDWRNYVNT